MEYDLNLLYIILLKCKYGVKYQRIEKSTSTYIIKLKPFPTYFHSHLIFLSPKKENK